VVRSQARDSAGNRRQSLKALSDAFTLVIADDPAIEHVSGGTSFSGGFRATRGRHTQSALLLPQNDATA
jgi:hypothetical protein